MTSSGDGTAHIWQCAVHLTNESSSGRMASSEDELDPLERESNQAFGKFFTFAPNFFISFSTQQCLKTTLKVSFLKLSASFVYSLIYMFNAWYLLFIIVIEKDRNVSQSQMTSLAIEP